MTTPATCPPWCVMAAFAGSPQLHERDPHRRARDAAALRDRNGPADYATAYRALIRKLEK